ncbi:PAS domain S-box protein [Niabella sp. CC-SYL272]|uniref:PAS domain-containing sensor histidine kinase n=1 Tax=Niabella agricola TaxID=2891571 RepID=UPI001F414D19|nr:PAS domain S-box protein [Niabella agricola]MCF3107616.1 PAS domain S-box protein [Niabella agricola]
MEPETHLTACIIAAFDAVFRMSSNWDQLLSFKGTGFLATTATPAADWVQKYIPLNAQAALSGAIGRGIPERKKFRFEQRVLTADGHTGWALFTAVPLLDHLGQFLEWFVGITDITESRRATDLMQTAKLVAERQIRLYETITASTPDLIYVFDLNYRFTYANKALLTMWGKSWDEAIGKGLRENGYEDWHAEMHEREIDTVRNTKQPIRGEVSFPHAVLGRRIYDYIFTPVFNERGEVEAVAGTTRDITEIRNAEMKIAESENRFRNMAEGTDVMINVTDAQGSNRYFNRLWAVVTGRSIPSLLASGWTDLVHPDDKARLENLLKLDTGRKLRRKSEFRMIRADGSYLWLLLQVTPRFHSDGSFAGYIHSLVDITEIKENEQRKNDFISTISHELRTPLTSATGFVEILQARALTDNDQPTAAMLTIVGKQLEKMTRMLHNFLNAARFESPGMHMHIERFDFRKLLHELEDELKTTVTSHTLSFKSVEAWVAADREKIAQVIHNLISNAVKYAPGGSAITIESHVTNGRLRLTVEDTGPGIRLEDQPLIFTRFYRVRNTQTKYVSGFGIGLFICSEIIKAHDGTIAVESWPGKGSAFYFTLPLASGDPATAAVD